MDKIKLKKNTIYVLLFQIITIICGFIIPKMILKYYGSEVNGLVNSIAQFLSVISFLELGVGAVVQTSLYKPLANKDYKKQSEIYVSAQKFFSKLAILLLIYIIGLIVLYPIIIDNSFTFLFTATLIIAIGVNSFSQYYFGIVNSLLLLADQNGYIQYRLQIITLLANTIISIILMKIGLSINIVKIVASIIYLSRPIYLNHYVKKHYHIDKKIKYIDEPIKSKWDGIAQHVAAIVLDGTDTIVLTIFATLKDVSIYSVYYLVISAFKQLFNSVANGIQSFLGKLYAINDNKALNFYFGYIEWIIHTITVLIFGCTSSLITPFVMLYTRGVSDANYNQILFGYLLSLAYAVFCLRLPYHIMVKVTGKYKETKKIYIISALINIIISIVLVKYFGIIGVSIGTLVAMTYQTISLSIFNSNKIMARKKFIFLKQCAIDIISFTIGVIIIRCFNYNFETIFAWILSAIYIFVLWSIIIIIVNAIFYNNNFKYIVKKMRGDKNG